jgi:hypothetical protein
MDQGGQGVGAFFRGVRRAPDHVGHDAVDDSLNLRVHCALLSDQKNAFAGFTFRA